MSGGGQRHRTRPPLLLGAGALLVLTEYAASRIRPSAPRHPAYRW
ncbi:hypothetical protein [Streptomyces sp. NPDC058622]